MRRWHSIVASPLVCTVTLAPAVLCNPHWVSAHHSYAMFDNSKTITVKGTIARLEWTNPHVFVWLYVKKGNQPGEFDLYGFENGPITMLMRVGWTRDSFKAGDRVSVQYFPLKDGRPGGSFIRAVFENGSVLIGDTHAPGVGAEIDKAAAADRTGVKP